MASSGLAHVMAAHSPLSARLAEEAGFDGLWASGFELSALYGLADVSLVSMTQHLEMLRAMAEQSSLPIVADIDTGFGNAVNVVHAIRQYERAGAAAVVIEDKSFPKVTSLVADGRQDLVRIEEFQGKIAAALATRVDPDFLVIARTEALIAGLGVAGAGVALAMQGVLSNVAAGLTIIFTRPFKVGEYIAIAGVEGRVEEISLFDTVLSHPDRSTVVVPNRKIVGEILHNYGSIRQIGRAHV